MNGSGMIWEMIYTWNDGNKLQSEKEKKQMKCKKRNDIIPKF